MTDPARPKDDDDFLSRWSRRKQAAAAEAKRARDVPPEQQPAAPPQSAATAEPEFDVSTLPPIDQITAITDVRDFLRSGVPVELTRAALRRAWSADPAIRDFVGLAENAWDFTAPDTIPGFGPLEASPEEIRRLVDRIVGSVGNAAGEVADTSRQPSPQNPALSSVQPPVTQEPESESDSTVGQTAAFAAASDADTAAQHPVQDVAEQSRPPRRRSHGSALPQ